MHVYRGLPNDMEKLPSAIAIGNFDGVHTGHQALIESVVQAAHDRALLPSVVTFEPHPREVLGGKPLPRISTLADKAEMMLKLGIERIYVLPFSKKMASLTAAQFVEQVLCGGLNARWVTVGRDFRFGSDRAGDVNSLADFGKTHGFETFIQPLLFHSGDKVSSSRIREALAQGDLYEVHLMLGRRYSITGRVIHGAALGRTIGFPTLNIAPIPPGSRAEPAAKGVYAVLVEGLGPGICRGVASMGVKPTVTDSARWLLETHVFDWKGDAYGKYVKVTLIEKLRGEQKFSSLEALRAQINDDALRARRRLGDAALLVPFPSEQSTISCTTGQ